MANFMPEFKHPPLIEDFSSNLLAKMENLKFNLRHKYLSLYLILSPIRIVNTFIQQNPRITLVAYANFGKLPIVFLKIFFSVDVKLPKRFAVRKPTRDERKKIEKN